MLHYEQVFGNVFERRESKRCAVLIIHHCKVKGEQVITLQIAQQLKTKNINFVQDNYFVVSVNFSLLQTLTMNSLSVKHQEKSSNQSGFHLSAYPYL